MNFKPIFIENDSSFKMQFGEVQTVTQLIGGGQSPGIHANITINGVGPDENGNFVINTLNDVEIAQLSAVLT